MSAAKMVADSTQSELTSESIHKSKKKKNSDKKIKKSKKSGKKVVKKKSKEEEEDDLLNDPDLDLAKEVKDIGDYVNDRPEMLKQMLNAVKGASLQRALPDVLKDLSLEHLEERCLQQLEVMSKKRIRRILNGDDPAAISSSGTEEDSTEEVDAEGHPTEGVTAADSTSNAEDLDSGDRGDAGTKEGSESEGEWRTPPPDECGSDMEEIEVEEIVIEVEDEDEEGEEEIVEYVEVEEEVTEEEEGEEDMEADNEEEEEKDEDGTEMESRAESKEKNVDEERPDEAVDENVKKMNEEGGGGESLLTQLTKNQMELLELEMRARAIKAMLKKHQSKEKK